MIYLFNKLKAGDIIHWELDNDQQYMWVYLGGENWKRFITGLEPQKSENTTSQT